MPKLGAYVLTEVLTRKFYVGSSHDVDKRVAQHVKTLNDGTHHCVNFQAIWKPNSGFVTTFFPTDTREEAYLLEQDILDRHADSPLLLNIGKKSLGGDNLSRHPEKERIVEQMKSTLRKRMLMLSDWEKQLIYGRPGELNGMWGKKHTQESRKLMSEALSGVTRRSGYKLSVEHRKKISWHASQRTGEKNPFFGKKHTDEFKAKLSKLRKESGTLPTNTRRVEVDGKEFESLTEASRQLGVSPALIVYRMKKGKQGYRYLS